MESIQGKSGIISKNEVADINQMRLIERACSFHPATNDAGNVATFFNTLASTGVGSPINLDNDGNNEYTRYHIKKVEPNKITCSVNNNPANDITLELN